MTGPPAPPTAPDLTALLNRSADFYAALRTVLGDTLDVHTRRELLAQGCSGARAVAARRRHRRMDRWALRRGQGESTEGPEPNPLGSGDAGRDRAISARTGRTHAELT